MKKLIRPNETSTSTSTRCASTPMVVAEKIFECMKTTCESGKK
jgi:hypothetical protein